MCVYSHLSHINCISRSHVLTQYFYSTESNTEESFTYEESLSLKIKLLNARRLYLKLNPTYIGIDLLNDSNQNTTLFRSSAEKRQFSKSSKKKQVADLKEEVSWILKGVYSVGTTTNEPFGRSSVNTGRVYSTEVEERKPFPINKRVESAERDL